jgi:hypothetical protein
MPDSESINTERLKVDDPMTSQAPTVRINADQVRLLHHSRARVSAVVEVATDKLTVAPLFETIGKNQVKNRKENVELITPHVITANDRDIRRERVGKNTASRKTLCCSDEDAIWLRHQ